MRACDNPHLTLSQRGTTALLSNTTLRIFQRGIDSLTTACGVNYRSTGGIPERGHLWDVRHDFAFLGVIHGCRDTWVFAS